MIVGVHNLHAGCEYMFAECYLHGSDDWSVAQLCLGILFDASLFVLLFELFMDGFVFAYVLIRKIFNQLPTINNLR
jgi:hypothetical protein